MQISDTFLWLLIVAGVILYVVLVNHVVRSRPGLKGLTVPFAFTLLSLYYLMKPLIIPNPYPTMREGMLMTFYGAVALLGYALYGFAKWRGRG